MFKKTSSISKQLVRNFVVAVASFVVDYAVFFIAERHIRPISALCLGYLAGLVINYVLSVEWVFNERRYSSEILQFGAFTLSALSGLGVEIVSFSIFRIILPDPIARLGSISVAFIWNFALKELILFRKKSRITFTEVIRSYSGLSLGEESYLALRFYTSPIEKICSFLPDAGTVLEVGCGSGINLVVAKLLKPSLTLTGSDIDSRKITMAQKIALNSVNISISDNLSAKTKYDAIMIVDVLYLLTKDQINTLITRCISSLSKDGVLLLKEMSSKPKWKLQWNALQETISTKITKITAHQNETFAVTTVEELHNILERSGQKNTIHKLDKKYLHPHALVVTEY